MRRKAEWAIDSEDMRTRRIIVLVKSNQLVKNIETKHLQVAKRDSAAIVLVFKAGAFRCLQPSSSSTNQNAALIIDHQFDFTKYFYSLFQHRLHCSHRRRGNFLPGGAVNHLPKKISQVAQIFTKKSKRNEGHIAITQAVLAYEGGSIQFFRVNTKSEHKLRHHKQTFGKIVDCKTVRIFAYSNTREQSNKRSGGSRASRA